MLIIRMETICTISNSVLGSAIKGRVPQTLSLKKNRRQPPGEPERQEVLLNFPLATIRGPMIQLTIYLVLKFAVGFNVKNTMTR